MTRKAAVTITVDDAHLAEIDRVAADLRREGMHVDQVLDAVGVITGSVSSECRPNLRTVAGVGSVEDAVTFQLPPPDAPLQ